MKYRLFHAALLPLIAMALLIVTTEPGTFAQNAYLVKDIDAKTRPKQFGETNYYIWIEFKGIAFFVMQSEAYGSELFKSDGTVAGTVLVKDVYPGAASSSPDHLTIVGDTLFFMARDEEHGTELWKTDGTEANTVLVKDIHLGIADTEAYPFYDHDGTLYFNAGDGTAGSGRLWKSDGTDAGTVRLTGADPDTPRLPWSFASMDGILYFSGSDSEHGNELWRSDGTQAGTYMVLDVYPGSASSRPSYLEPLDGVMCFVAHFSGDPSSLWRTDGTAAGTHEIDNRVAYSIHRINVGNRLFFSKYIPAGYSHELWTTDGNTVFMVREFHLEVMANWPHDFNLLRGQVYFVADDGARGEELWTVLLDTLTTYLVQDANPGPEGVAFSDIVKAGDLLYSITTDGQIFRSDGSPMGTYLIDRSGLITTEHAEIVPFGNEAFFTGDQFERIGLWRSDGTDTGTVRVKLDDPGGNWSVIRTRGLQGTAGGRLFLLASDDLRGKEMWSSDGSEAGTIALTDLFPDPTGGSDISQLTAVGGDRVFFFVDEGEGGQSGLWKSDGTEAGTVQVRAFDLEGVTTWNFTDVEGTLFFTRCIRSVPAWELWISDGTEAGTMFFSVIYGSSPDMLTSFNGLLYFGADDDLSGPGLWRSDGSQAGTYIIHDVFPHGLTLLDGLLYYSDDDGGLWESDGTDAGAIRLVDIPGNAYEFENSLGMLYFRSRDSETGSELWKSDLTLAGTLMVTDICPGSCGAYPSGLTDSNDLLFFLAKQESDPHGLPYLFRSDGTGPGTSALMQLDFDHYGMFTSDYSDYLAAFKGFLYFHDESLIPLYKTDGTDIISLEAGECGYIGHDMTPAGDVMFYSGTSAVKGNELCKTDGEVAGTVVAADIMPGHESSEPEQLTLTGSRLLFTANDGFHGGELWALDIGREDLLRNDLVTSIYPVVTPPLADLLPLDPVADAYRSDFASGEKEPEAGVLTDDRRPLIFYGLDAEATVLLVKDGQEDIKIFF